MKILIYRHIWLGGKNIAADNKGESIGDIDVTPFGAAEFHERYKVLYLAMVYKGIGDFLERIYQPGKFNEMERLPYGIKFVAGTTNLRMAELATRFGFKIEHAPDITKDEIESKKGEVTIYAKIPDIKMAYDRFEKSGVGEKIFERAKRERSSLNRL